MVLNSVGDRFGRLEIIAPAERKGRLPCWTCRCDCGTVLAVKQVSLRIGETKSCGCLRRDSTRERSTTHGYFGTQVHTCWINIINRCANPKSDCFDNYGGRGITVCERWTNSFETFLVDMGEPATNMTIERINNEGNYEPGNCRWATRKEQCRNKRTNLLVTFDGKTKCLKEFAEELKLNYQSLYRRIKAGWSVEKALTVPMRRMNRCYQ